MTIKVTPTILFSFESEDVAKGLFDSISNNGMTGTHWRGAGEYSVIQPPGTAYLMAHVPTRYRPGEHLSHPEFIWQQLLPYFGEEARARVPSTPWFHAPSAQEQVGYLALLAAQSDPPPDLLFNTFEPSVHASMQDLQAQMDKPIAVLETSGYLDPADVAHYLTLADSRHVVILGGHLLTHRVQSYPTRNELGVDLPLINANPHALTVLAEEYTARGLTYLGPLYHTGLPPVVPTPVLGLRFEEATLLFGAIETGHKIFLLDYLTGCLKAGDFGVERATEWIQNQTTARFERQLRDYNQALIDEARASRAALRTETEALLNRYLDAERRLRAANLMAEHGERELDQRGIERIKRMIRNGSLTEVRMRNGAVIANTKHIYLKDERSGMWHDIGAFEMHIHLGTGRYRFINQTRAYPRHHPHVFADGEPCLGNLAEAVPSMRAERDWPAFIELGLLYLESVNYSDTHMNIHQFPVVLDPEAVGLGAHDGDTPRFGLPLPDDIPEGDEDFGEVGTHCVVRRKGVVYYHLAGSHLYFTYGGDTVEASALDPDYRGEAEVEEEEEPERERVAVVRGEAYDPDDYNDYEDLVDDHGTLYTWDDQAGRHLDENGYDPEGYDEDGIDEEGYDRHDRIALDFAGRVASELRVRGWPYLAERFLELDLGEVFDRYQDAVESPVRAANNYITDEATRFGDLIHDWLSENGHDHTAAVFHEAGDNEVLTLQAQFRNDYEAAAEEYRTRVGEPQEEVA